MVPHSKFLVWQVRTFRPLIKLLNFHKQIFLFLENDIYHNFSSHNSTVWNNRVVTLKSQSSEEEWFEKDITYITDLMDGNGIILSFTDITEKYHLNCSL